MERWTMENNTYLSCLLDDVSGTEEEVKIRQDFCVIHDCVRSTCLKIRIYYTGSKAEGLALRDSDDDFMWDITDPKNIDVSESIQDLIESTRPYKFHVITDNVPPGFALLKCVDQVQGKVLPFPIVHSADGDFLRSSTFVLPYVATLDPECGRFKITGPSIETWGNYCDISKSGTDTVPSIHCKFWPTTAAEWIDRPRQYEWPSSSDKVSIVAFGCHLVPVGHSLSLSKAEEWRLSFSIAERILVWSFNHTQIQCYMTMKLILKEFVKVNCAERHKDVLCSYFIKTFLFWQFETTDPLFWQSSNLRGCLMYLFNEFHKCIQIGVLRHYFTPRFNLFAVKLTRDAQFELSQIFNVVIQTDLRILGECASLSGVWSKFQKTVNVNQINSGQMDEVLKHQVACNDQHLMNIFKLLIREVVHKSLPNYKETLIATHRLIDKSNTYTCLPTLTVRELCLSITIEELNYSFIEGRHCSYLLGNKSQYHHIKRLDKNVYGTDITSSKLWLATFLVQQRDYFQALSCINCLLSSIPPHALYVGSTRVNMASKLLFEDRFYKKNVETLSRAKDAWLLSLAVFPQQYMYLPRAIQIERYFADRNLAVMISPYTYAYYLMFLCYHGLGQYDDRDRALLLLIDTVNDKERDSVYIHNACNIVGHCLLMTGETEEARAFFLRSVLFTHQFKGLIDKHNSAYHYLSLM